MIRKITNGLLLSTALLSYAMVAGTAAAKEPALTPVSDLVNAINIPYESFTLDNGLRVVVHQDRKAPLVAVSVWYRVGSKHEPNGKTGFAHLFEHLMFNGSENSPGDFFEPLQQVGATDYNGTTNTDRTNYFETVPSGALDRALFLESDRMGYLLGAVTQEKLDNQRGVVQNEKRQGDNNPYGLLRYEIFENLYPEGHPYHHSTIGSMADLNAASLTDVKNWFSDNYGPNNAVLVLAGDIDVATAKQKVQNWFGDIPKGAVVAPVKVPVPTLAYSIKKTIKDLVPTTRIYRMWAVPGVNDADAVTLQMAASILGGLSSSRLDNALVRNDPVAVSTSASAQTLEDGGFFIIQADVKPGVDIAKLTERLDGTVQKFLTEGPTEDEIRRAQTSYLSGTISGLESVGGFGGKAVALAEGALYSGDPGYYKTELKRLAAVTPAQVKAATGKWLSRPVFSLTIEPGERTEGGENRGGAVISDTKPSTIIAPDQYWNSELGDNGPSIAATNFAPDRSQLPSVGDLQGLDFPAIERGKLKNGMEVIFARRAAVPTVNITVSFDAGYSADPKQALGTQSLMLAMMEEGTATLNSTKLAEAQERLGANVSLGASNDNTFASLFALKANLKPSVALLNDVLRNPAFDASELERLRAQQLNRINSELKNPQAIASRKLLPAIYGAGHPYSNPSSGTGDAEVVKKLSRDNLIAFHNGWIRPDNGRVFVVGDTSLKEVTKILNTSLGKWKAPASARSAKDFDAVVPVPKQRIILIDRPKSPQSVILAGKVLSVKGTDELETLRAANEVFGGSFLSRINSNLRETKGWSYGVRSQISNGKQQVNFIMAAPVQADRTGDSIKELRSDLKAFLSDKGITSEELTRTINGNVRELPGSFETSGDVMGGLQNIVNYSRPDDYYEKLAGTYKGMTAEQIDAAARKVLATDDMVFVVVGDAKTVKAQLESTGLPIEIAGETATPKTTDAK